GPLRDLTIFLQSALNSDFSTVGARCPHQIDGYSSSARGFFEADPVAIEEAPNPTRTHLHSPHRKALRDLLQGQIGLEPNQLKQPVLLLVQKQIAPLRSRFGLDTARHLKSF